jgi:hypothetical protein
MKLPSHPKALALLAAIFPVMDRRTRHSAAWVLVAGLSFMFWFGVGLLLFLFFRLS